MGKKRKTKMVICAGALLGRYGETASLVVPPVGYLAVLGAVEGSLAARTCLQVLSSGACEGQVREVMAAFRWRLHVHANAITGLAEQCLCK